MDPFITVSDLGDYLGQDLTSDAAAQIAVEGACDIVRTITEQDFDAVASDTIVLDGTGTQTLTLPQNPVTSVASVTEGNATLTADVDYRLGDNGILHRLPGVFDSGWGTEQWRTYWWPGTQNITVTYAHGYLPQDLPNDIRMCALTIAARLLNQASIGNAIESEESLGAYSTRTRYAANSSAADLTSGEQAILRKYRVTH